MIYSTVENNDGSMRVAIVATLEDGAPAVKHFYLERKGEAKNSWVRGTKIEGEELQKNIEKFDFDPVEVQFSLEESAEKALEMEGE